LAEHWDFPNTWIFYSKDVATGLLKIATGIQQHNLGLFGRAQREANNNNKRGEEGQAPVCLSRESPKVKIYGCHNTHTHTGLSMHG
jgi:hypothetical protein